MPIRGKRLFYQKAEICIAGVGSDKKLDAMLKQSFDTLVLAPQRIVTHPDQSEWHLNKLTIESSHLFFHIIHLKPGHQRSGYRRTANDVEKIVSIPAGVDTEFILHDVCGLISGNDVIMYGGVPNDRSIPQFVNGILKKAALLASNDVVIIKNVLKHGALSDLERHGVDSIDLDVVQNSELIGIAAHQRAGFFGKLLHSDLAKEDKIKVHLKIDSNGHFRKSMDIINAQMIEEAKALVGEANDSDWDGIKITLKNGTVLQRGKYLESADIDIARIGETISPSDAAQKMLDYWSSLNSSGHTVRD